MAMRDCKNPTCDRKGTATYCSRECQLAMRTASKGRSLPDIWVPMAVWHRLVEQAARDGLTVKEYITYDIIDGAHR
jgi:hypothetical protein